MLAHPLSPSLTLTLLLPLLVAVSVGAADTPYDTATPATLPSTPGTPPLTTGTSGTPSRVVYADEDPLASRLAWLQGRAEQSRAGGAWRYVESPLHHPTELPPPHLDSYSHTDSDVLPPDSLSRDYGLQKGKGAVRKWDDTGDGSRTKPFGFPPRRERSRVNEAPLHSSVHDWSPPPSAPPLPVYLDQDRIRPGSPTRWALDQAAERLEALARHRGSPSSSPSSHDRLSPGTSLNEWRDVRTPPSPRTPHTPEPARWIAPYRQWSVRASLPSINLHGVTRLSDRYPADHVHFSTARTALSSHEWTAQLSTRIQWAASHRVDASRPARVVTPFGALMGGEISTASPSFLYDAKDPPPPLESVALTGTQKRVNAWKQLAGMLPPALTGHSRDVYEAHRRGAYRNVERGTHDALHPIQYLGQMLRDRNGAVVLENAIHDELQSQKVPPEALAHLQNRGKGGPEDLLGTEYATYNKFWYPYYHSKPAFRIKNPLDTPLEHFAAFAPFADAVALKKV
ncbi:hypothetical protein PSEUBRA_003835 [Kalmanozyma brasiliensis GHG001]|uniref:uncharacterized protein n=1 Tax=Kalmanozyma brasiliensis (strain GHG001) TaxID=1365824 RepID=UPI001CE93D60|nr:uncharacterized protein PSEUBRA_003835 [Kalmanozyma brasiliensis GHG001]KAF6767300.1 hypothetical protein PSEUBRA_003835 [Kalmanozyma brasiliensis GHG001]